MPKLIERFQRIAKWTSDDLWRIRLENTPKIEAVALRWLRIAVLSIREFGTDRCSLRASALTFYSVLSIVPVAALTFGIAKGFGMDQVLEQTIRERLPGQEEIVNRVIEFSRKQLTETRGGVVAGVGVGVLVWTVLRVLSNIERSLNTIWGVTKERSWARKFSDYLAFMLISPIVIVMASSLTVYVINLVQRWTESAELWDGVSAPVLMGLRLLPGTLIWALFTFMYVFMPNTKVRFSSAMLGGVVAGTAYQLTQAAYVHFQIGASQFGAIYGSFAALPLFFIWMQASWLIVLYGAELAYAHQNVDQYEYRPDAEKMSPAFRRLLALAIVRHCVGAFERSEVPPDAEAINQALGAPANLVNGLLENLVDSGVLAEAAVGPARAAGYLPARSTGELTIAQILVSLDSLGAPDIPLAESQDLEKLRTALLAFEQEAAASPANLSIRDV